jgi:hypothetical protein
MFQALLFTKLSLPGSPALRNWLHYIEDQMSPRRTPPVLMVDFLCSANQASQRKMTSDSVNTEGLGRAQGLTWEKNKSGDVVSQDSLSSPLHALSILMTR